MVCIYLGRLDVSMQYDREIDKFNQMLGYLSYQIREGLQSASFVTNYQITPLLLCMESSVIIINSHTTRRDHIAHPISTPVADT